MYVNRRFSTNRLSLVRNLRGTTKRLASSSRLLTEAEPARRNVPHPFMSGKEAMTMKSQPQGLHRADGVKSATEYVAQKGTFEAASILGLSLKCWAHTGSEAWARNTSSNCRGVLFPAHRRDGDQGPQHRFHSCVKPQLCTASNASDS